MAYNGWSNYETWAVNLWLTNDQATYNLCRELARNAKSQAGQCSQVRDGIWQLVEARKYLLADQLKEYVEESNPLLNQAHLYSDLLNAALSEVNWHEVADAFLEE